MRHFVVGIGALAVLSFSAILPADARPARGATNYDGAWHLSFMTQSGACDPSYEFDVNISRGVISHPNLVRLRGSVSPGGVTRASVAVQDKVASGSGRLSATSGRGSWSGTSGTARCAGYWVAQRN